VTLIIALRHHAAAVMCAVLAMAAVLTATVSANAQTGALPTTKLAAGIHLITAEVASTDRSRARGLMFRERLAPNHGMLFIFDSKSVHCMWMRNTLIPLSVAFIDDNGSIVNIEDMQPHDESSHCAAKPVRYALEMDKGWFAQRGLKAEARISGLPTTAR